MWTQCTTVLVNKACLPDATVSTQLAVTHIAVNITHGTVIAFQIGTFRVIEKKTEGFSLFQSENYERTLYLWMSKIRCNFQFPVIRNANRTSSVSIVTTFWAGRPRNRGSILDRGLRFLFSPDRFWYPNQTRVQWALYFLPQRSKRLKLEGGHLSLHIAEFKNAWCYTSISPYAFTAWC
jgi:hypothetical protein